LGVLGEPLSNSEFKRNAIYLYKLSGGYGKELFSSGRLKQRNHRTVLTSIIKLICLLSGCISDPCTLNGFDPGEIAPLPDEGKEKHNS
jgi:hypothetical protein